MPIIKYLDKNVITKMLYRLFFVYLFALIGYLIPSIANFRSLIASIA